MCKRAIKIGLGATARYVGQERQSAKRKPMKADKNELAALEDDILADIEDHGFSFYKMAPPP